MKKMAIWLFLVLSALTVAAPGQRNNFRMNSPAEGEVMSGPSITISGNAPDGKVSLSIYRGRDLVVERSLGTPRGEWYTTLNMEQGFYRVEARWNNQTIRRNFVVGGHSASSRTTISLPRPNQTVAKGVVRFEGTSGEKNVTLIVTSGRREVFRTLLNVAYNRWGAGFDLNEGNYTATIISGRNNQTSVNFRVGRGGETNHPGLTITQPYNGETLRPGKFNFSGTTNEKNVLVRITKDRKLVYSQQLGVVKGKWWADTRLERGDYVMTVTSGRQTQSVRFSIR
jgi:hypothetical protein